MLTQTNSAGGSNHPGPLSPDAILTALDPEQREVALALNGPVVVLAGAGTGKTRAITTTGPLSARATSRCSGSSAVRIASGLIGPG